MNETTPHSLLILRKLKDAPSTEEFIQQRLRWERDHEWWVDRDFEKRSRSWPVQGTVTFAYTY
jgi:hypothetical protein